VLCLIVVLLPPGKNPFAVKINNKNINEFTRNSKYKDIRDLYRGMNEFKRGYQLRGNISGG
jgi:hypothetical protein